MADVFISYASEDREVAENIAKALMAAEYSVWWDREILGGENFDEVIERELDLAKTAIVLWSTHSVRSNWVKSEAAAAAERGVLVPVLIEQINLPLEFRRIHTIDLTAWSGDPDGSHFSPLRRVLAVRLKRDQVREPVAQLENKEPLNASARSLARRVWRDPKIVGALAILFILGSTAAIIYVAFMKAHSPVKGPLKIGYASKVEPHKPEVLAASPQRPIVPGGQLSSPSVTSDASDGVRSIPFAAPKKIGQKTTSDSPEHVDRDLARWIQVAASEAYDANQTVESDLNSLTTDFENLLKARVQSLDSARDQILQARIYADHDAFNKHAWWWFDVHVSQGKLLGVLDANATAEAQALAKRYNDSLKKSSIVLNPLWFLMESRPVSSPSDQLARLLDKIHSANKANSDCRAQIVNAFIALLQNLPSKDPGSSQSALCQGQPLAPVG